MAKKRKLASFYDHKSVMNPDDQKEIETFTAQVAEQLDEYLPLMSKKLSDKAIIPRRAHSGDSGYDVYACFRPTPEENWSIQPDDMKSGLNDVEKPCYLLFQGPSEYKSQSRFILYPGGRVAIPTGIAVACSPDTSYFVKPRSGLAFRHGINTLAGVVDSGYRNEVLIILHNAGITPIDIYDGDKVAQIVPVKLTMHAALDLREMNELPDSQRGLAGFGSTGR